MTTGADAEMTFVVGARVFTVRTAVASDGRTAEVTVQLDGQREWRYEEPAWRPIALGVAAEVPYLWTARSLVVLPVASDEPEVIQVDEDLLLVFRAEAGWLLVCEASIRLVVDGHENACVELGEVVESATWNGTELTVHDARGHGCRIRVDETRLTITGDAA